MLIYLYWVFQVLSFLKFPYIFSALFSFSPYFFSHNRSHFWSLMLTTKNCWFLYLETISLQIVTSGLFLIYIFGFLKVPSPLFKQIWSFFIKTLFILFYRFYSFIRLQIFIIIIVIIIIFINIIIGIIGISSFLILLTFAVVFIILLFIFV